MSQCLVAAVRPLDVEELAEFLAFDFEAEEIPGDKPGMALGNEEEAITIVSYDGERIVQFSHFSVKEF